MFNQLSLADCLNQMNEPISVGDYVEHMDKPGLILYVVKNPYTTRTGHIGLDVKDPSGRVLPVHLVNVHRI